VYAECEEHYSQLQSCIDGEGTEQMHHSSGYGSEARYAKKPESLVDSSGLKGLAKVLVVGVGHFDCFQMMAHRSHYRSSLQGSGMWPPLFQADVGCGETRSDGCRSL